MLTADTGLVRTYIGIRWLALSPLLSDVVAGLTINDIWHALDMARGSFHHLRCGQFSSVLTELVHACEFAHQAV